MGSICSNCGNASNQSKFHRKFQNPCCNNEMLLDFDSIKNLKAEVERLEKELSDAQSCVAKMEHEANNRSMINSRRFRDE